MIKCVECNNKMKECEDVLTIDTTYFRCVECGYTVEINDKEILKFMKERV